MITSTKDLLPNCNHIVTGIVRYYTDDYEKKLVENEKAKLLANLASRVDCKPIIIKCFLEKLSGADKTGANLLLITIKTYWLNLLDCEIGEICYYEHHEYANTLELDDNEYHFKKLDSTDYSLWLRVR
jgi:hypothetical protein